MDDETDGSVCGKIREKIKIDLWRVYSGCQVIFRNKRQTTHGKYVDTRQHEDGHGHVPLLYGRDVPFRRMDV